MRGARDRLPGGRLVPALFILFAALWGSFLAAWHLEGRASPLDRLEAVTLDWRHGIRGSRAPPEEVVVVAIDEAAIRRAGGWPVSRRVLAEAVGRLADAGVAVVAVDILFLEPGRPRADTALALALARVPAVIAAAMTFDDAPAEADELPPVPFGPRVPVATGVAWPAEPVGRVRQVAAVNLSTDGGGTPRHVPLLFQLGETAVPSFALAAAGLHGGGEVRLGADEVRIGETVQPLDLGRHLALAFYGPGKTVRHVSLAGVLDGTVPREALAGRIAVVGTTALGAGDTFDTPFDPVMPGAEVLATAIGNLLRGEGLDRSPAVRRADAAAAVALPVLAVLVLAWRRTAPGFAILAGLLAGWLAATVVAFERGTWLSVTLPLAAVLPVAALFVAVLTWRERRAATLTALARDALASLHPPVLADRLARDPDYLATPAVREGCVLFFDLAGFTGLAERLGPEGTLAFQNALMDRVERAIVPRGGAVLGFLGDGALIVFGLPEPARADAADALAALAVLSAALGDLSAPGETGAVPARFGLAAGPLALSRVGTRRQATVTVTGDTVNLASRLMEEARARGRDAGVAEAVFAALPPGARCGEIFSGVERVAVRGLARPVEARFADAADLARMDAAGREGQAARKAGGPNR